MESFYFGAASSIDAVNVKSTITVQSDVDGVGTDITAASLDVTMDDTTGAQRIQLSVDPDADDWRPSNDTEDNTEAIDVDVSDVESSTITGRVTLDAYSPDGARSQTPRVNYASQSLQSWELRVNRTDVVVFGDRRYTGGDWTNLKDMHEDADMAFIVEPPASPGDPPAATSLVLGSETREALWTETSHTRETTSRGYANSQRVYGPVQDDGTRLKATAKATDEIDTYGEVPAEPEVREDLETSIDLEDEARRLLARRIRRDERVRGPLEIYPQHVTPAYAYPFSEFGDEERVLTRVELSTGVDGTEATLHFETDDDWLKLFGSLQTSVRRTRRIE